MSARCRLGLILDLDAAPAGRSGHTLASVLAAAPIASVAFYPASTGADAVATLKPLVDIAQRASAAALVVDNAALAGIVNADGVHVAWSKDTAGAYRAARDELGARFIVGVDAGRSRHDAMTAGEAGCDYVAFGIPAHVEDRATAAARQIELVAWWSEIFEVPCVAFDVADADHAARLADAGADFIAIKLDVAAAERDPTAWLAPYAAAAANAGKAA